MRISKYIAVAGVVAVVVGLSACSSTPSGTSSSSSDAPIGGDVVTPLTVEANDLQGETVDLVVGQMLNINTGDLATDSYTGVVEARTDEPVDHLCMAPGVVTRVLGEHTAVAVDDGDARSGGSVDG